MYSKTSMPTSNWAYIVYWALPSIYSTKKTTLTGVYVTCTIRKSLMSGIYIHMYRLKKKWFQRQNGGVKVGLGMHRLQPRTNDSSTQYKQVSIQTLPYTIPQSAWVFLWVENNIAFLEEERSSGHQNHLWMMGGVSSQCGQQRALWQHQLGLMMTFISKSVHEIKHSRICA